MNVLYCGDQGVEKGIFLSAASILATAKERVDFFIMTASVGKRAKISDDFVARLAASLSKIRKDFGVRLIDATQSFGSYLPTANMGTRFTPLCMLRLFADRENAIPEKILYLDADVLALKDFGELYDEDMTDVEIAGVPDRYGSFFFGNVFKRDYLNSGVLLLNMTEIRKSGLFERCRKTCAEKKMFMPDQSALNKAAKKKKVNRKFNEQGSIKKQTVFKHFTTFFRFFPFFKAVTIKPWEIEKVRSDLKINQFNRLYDFYKKEYLSAAIDDKTAV